MKVKGSLLELVALIFVFVTSCTKDNHPNYTYFVSSDLALSYKAAYINNMLNTASVSYPEVKDLIPFVSGDVNIYKLVYKTTINGEKINASGLICVPEKPGDYPVLCFQNGTNTVKAYAPSEFVINTPYQMIEFIASMGYVVLIADYPGFGESDQVPHPYLITEPTVRSIVDMLFAVKEIGNSEFSGITIKNEYYLLGYSQGGWATLTLHKALEQTYQNDFNLKGSVCGAGPYDILFLFQDMISTTTYPMPIYIGYIVNAYSAYKQFTNPVTDILNEPYASRLSSLYTGSLTSDQINNQLTTSIPGLITADFLSGFVSASKYTSVREALNNNSVSAWHTMKPLFFLHGGNDTDVNPLVTDHIYDAMIQAGTSAEICKKEIIPGLDHGKGVLPCMTKGLLFILNLTYSK
jgi:pimeloyl-ACP methyl ester carboxylesterase